MSTNPETTTERKTVVMLHESIWQSAVRDAGTLVMIIAVIGVGWWLGSDAMQWMGFIMLCLGLITRAAGHASNRMTPQEAANFLRQKFGVQADAE